LSAFWISGLGGQQSGFPVSSVISEKMGRSYRADLPADRDAGMGSNPVCYCQSTDREGGAVVTACGHFGNGCPADRSLGLCIFDETLERTVRIRG